MKSGIIINTMKKQPIDTIKKLTDERYALAKAVFWAGSVSQDQATESSDLDLVIVFESIPYAYREAYIYDGWPIDTFVHDASTLKYFFEESKSGNGISGLIEMILGGREILNNNDFSNTIRDIATQYKTSGPSVWSQDKIDLERFLITDILDDIKFPRNRAEQIASTAHLFEPLLQFYFRANGNWTASAKSLIRLLQSENPSLAAEYNQSFEILFQTGDVKGLEKVLSQILAPYGGLLWDGFRSNAAPEYRL